MQIFYIPNIDDKEFFLNEIESKHCVRVLRLTNGSKIQLVDGKGNFFHAEIADAHPKRCKVTILEKIPNFNKKDNHLHIAIAPTKNIDRFEWFLEKATEIGINEITPILTEHSERKIIKPERLNKILVSAMKQSVKAYLPKLNEMTSLNNLIAGSTTDNRFIAHCYDGEKKHLKEKVIKGKNIQILIGPEGDFSKSEVEFALKNGFQEVSLGNSRLRTETAGIVACHIVNLINE